MKHSCGIVPYRYNKKGELEIFLCHPGGPYSKNLDAGAWSIPKGEKEKDETEKNAALREFTEETGYRTKKPLIPLGKFRQNSSKKVTAYAVNINIDPDKARSNYYEEEFPPKSGKMKSFPENDRYGWFCITDVEKKIVKGQMQIVKKLEEVLKRRNIVTT